MASNRFGAGKKIYDYFPEVARSHMSKKEARAEYARLRKIANRRLEALQRNYPKSEIARRYRKGFTALPRGEEKSSRIFKKLYEVARYLNTATGSVSGQRAARKQQLETLREHGYTFINKKNLDEFNEFWRTVKTHAAYSGAMSEEIVELFGKAKKTRTDPQTVAKAFEKYLDKDGPFNGVEVNITGRDEDY